MKHSEEGRFVDVIYDYNFKDATDVFVSLSELPVRWKHHELVTKHPGVGSLFLSGSVGNLDHFREVGFEVKEWTFDITHEDPDVFVLVVDLNLPCSSRTAGQRWLKLHCPNTTYMRVVRPILVCLYSLSFCRQNPEASKENLMDYIWTIFSSYQPMPTMEDLWDNIEFIKEVIKYDEELKKSEALTAIVEDPEMKTPFDESSLLRQLVRGQHLDRDRMIMNHNQNTNLVNRVEGVLTKHADFVEVTLQHGTELVNQQNKVLEVLKENKNLRNHFHDTMALVVNPCTTVTVALVAALISKGLEVEHRDDLLISALLWFVSTVGLHLLLNRGQEDPATNVLYWFLGNLLFGAAFVPPFILFSAVFLDAKEAEVFREVSLLVGFLVFCFQLVLTML